MEVGAGMFFTDYSIAPGELAQALEARGFESVWAPEHSHIPTSRRTPFPQGGELPKKYAEAMDPFVSLTAAAIGLRTANDGACQRCVDEHYVHHGNQCYALSISWVLISPDEASETRIALHGRQGAMTPG